MPRPLTDAGTEVLRHLSASGGRRPDYVVDGRPLARLEEDGYVRLEQEMTDRGADRRPRRRIFVVLTDAGREALDLRLDAHA